MTENNMFGLYRARDLEKAAKSAARIHALCFPQAWDISYFQSLLNNPATAIFFAREADEDVAVILLQKVENEAEILTLGVLPKVQREGIGSGLLWFAEKGLEKEGCNRFFLEVSAVNTPALMLYNRLEYKEINTRKAYYQDGSDAICMEKRFIL